MIDSTSESAGGVADLKKGRRRRSVSSTPNDRLPPRDAETEQAVIGCIVDFAGIYLAAISEKISNEAEAFYDLRNQMIYLAACDMAVRGKQIDLVTLQAELSDRKQLDQIGGIPYLQACSNAVTSAANIAAWLDTLLEKHLLRKMIHACTNAIGEIYDYSGELDELLDKVEKDVLAVARKRTEGDSAKDAKTLVHRTIAMMEDLHQRKGVITGLSTGFPDLDKLTDGLHNGEMIVIAARPSKGKTALAMDIARHVSIENTIPTAVFSLEMQADALMMRMLCSMARVNLTAVRDGFLSEGDFPKINKATTAMSAAPLYIDDTSGLSIMQLRGRARRLQQQFGIKLFVVDYLQLLHSTNQRAENRQQEIADISAGIKGMAKELGVPVIVISQLNRDVEREKGRKPRMSDLRESGAIEQDADLVGLLYEPDNEKEDETQQESEGCAMNLLIAKQRNGPVGDVHFTFLKPYTRFEPASKISDDEAPGRYASNDP